MEHYYKSPGLHLNELASDDDDLKSLQEMMVKSLADLTQDILQAQGRMNAKADFIGAQPISLMRLHLNDIQHQKGEWLICEKTDGVRYLMIVLSNGHVYLTGRNVGGLKSFKREYQFYRVNLKIPQLCFYNPLQVMEIFDGELIIDRFFDGKGNTNEYLHYLIFDTLLHNGNQKLYFNTQPPSCVPYYERLKCAEEFLDMIDTMKHLNKTMITEKILPLNHMAQIKPILKDFFMVPQLNYLLNHYIKTLHHENDGIIFTKNNEFYSPGTCQAILKWKPPHLNTIDFLITPNKFIEFKDPDEALLELYLMDNVNGESQLIFFDFIHTNRRTADEVITKIEEVYNQQDENEVQSVPGVIAECNLVRQETQTKLATLCQPNQFDCPDHPIEPYFNSLIQTTVHYDKHIFQGNEGFRKNQHQLLQTVRELVHLRDNFKSKWKILKYRTDKATPNYHKVALNVLQCISENITPVELINLVK